MITKQIPLLLSSGDPKAINKTNNGSQFTLQLDGGDLKIPPNALNTRLYVQDCEFFYTFPNIINNINNSITITYDNGIDPLFTFNITIPQGLYSITELDDELQVQLFNQPNYPEANPLIELIGSDAQQKVQIKYNYDGVRVDLTGSQTFRDIIGFNSGLYPIAGPSQSNTFDTAQNIAKFNTLLYILFSVNLCDFGIRVNNRYDYYVARVLITVSPGQQQAYQPPIKYYLSANRKLNGRTISNIQCKIVDQDGNAVNTNNENFSIFLVIEYEIPSEMENKIS